MCSQPHFNLRKTSYGQNDVLSMYNKRKIGNKIAVEGYIFRGILCVLCSHCKKKNDENVQSVLNLIIGAKSNLNQNHLGSQTGRMFWLILIFNHYFVLLWIFPKQSVKIWWFRFLTFSQTLNFHLRGKFHWAFLKIGTLARLSLYMLHRRKPFWFNF